MLSERKIQLEKEMQVRAHGVGLHGVILSLSSAGCF
jgi:hypothetical protein